MEPNLVNLKSGKYVVAVSGGVDSMVLLDMLSGQPGLDLVVAHFEHGIRTDSDDDRQLVEVVARAKGVPFIFERGYLGAGASEATARAARFAFLEKVRAEQGAEAIVTAHHQDDVVETALINMLRGTGRKGLSSLAARTQVMRPLLQITKREILAYAQERAITWHEDSTNADDRYLRNYLRHTIIPKLSAAQRQVLLAHITQAHTLNAEIDGLLVSELSAHAPALELDRAWFIGLPYDVAAEAMAAWLRQNDIRDFDRKLISRLVVAAKTAHPGKVIDVQSGHQLEINRNTVQLLMASGSQNDSYSV